MKYEIRLQAILYFYYCRVAFLDLKYMILTIDALAPPKEPSEVWLQAVMPAANLPSVCLHGDIGDVKSQDSLVAFFKLTTPFAHAALADNQNTATMTVKQKSLNNEKKCQKIMQYL